MTCRKYRASFNQSEPEFLISCLDRHRDGRRSSVSCEAVRKSIPVSRESASGRARCADPWGATGPRDRTEECRALSGRLTRLGTPGLEQLTPVTATIWMGEASCLLQIGPNPARVRDRRQTSRGGRDAGASGRG
jgi:hypothetical protein